MAVAVDYLLQVSQRLSQWRVLGKDSGHNIGPFIADYIATQTGQYKVQRVTLRNSSLRESQKPLTSRMLMCYSSLNQVRGVPCPQHRSSSREHDKTPESATAPGP